MSTKNKVYSEEELEKIKSMKQTHLWAAIQRQLLRRKDNAKLLYDLLMAIKAKKYAGNPDDEITNPLAIGNYGSKPLYTDVAEKRIAFELGVEDGMVAYTGFQKSIPLGGPGAEFNDVEYIAGLWRVQNKTKFKTIRIQDEEFILLEKLRRTEHTDFEYYSAARVNWGSCGQFCDFSPDYIVAKYKTGRGTFYAYGCKLIDQDALATARAHLAGQLYITYQDLIQADTIRTLEQNQK